MSRKSGILSDLQVHWFWLIVITGIIFLLFGWEVYRAKQENYTLLWQRVNSIWRAYCEDVPIETCRPSLNFPCEKCD